MKVIMHICKRHIPVRLIAHCIFFFHQIYSITNQFYDLTGKPQLPGLLRMPTPPIFWPTSPCKLTNPPHPFFPLPPPCHPFFFTFPAAFSFHFHYPHVFIILLTNIILKPLPHPPSLFPSPLTPPIPLFSLFLFLFFSFSLSSCFYYITD